MKPILYITRDLGGFSRILAVGTLPEAFNACKSNSFSEIIRVADKKRIAWRWAIKRVVGLS